MPCDAPSDADHPATDSPAPFSDTIDNIGSVAHSIPNTICAIDAVAYRVPDAVATLSTTVPPSTVTGVTFANAAGTQIGFANVTFDANCVPTKYLLGFNGPAALLSSSPAAIPVSFANLLLDVDARSDPAQFRVTGGISGSCFGGPAALMTVAPLQVSSGANCPTDGEISATTAAGSAQVFYRANGSIDVDVDGNGSIDTTFQNCFDARLLACPA